MPSIRIRAGLAEAGQPGDADEPGVRHHRGHPHPVQGGGVGDVDVRADLQHRTQGQRGAAEAQQRQQPRAAPPPGGHQPEQGEQAQHQAVGGDPVDEPARVDEPGGDVQPERGHPRGELEHAGEPDRVGQVGGAQVTRRGGGAAGSGLLGDGDELRAADQQGHQPGQRGRPQLRHRRTPDQPRHQRGAGQDDHQHGHLLISQQRPADHHPQHHRPPPPRPPRQPHRGLQRQRQEQRPRRQVQVIPGPPRQHRRQPEKRPRRDRAHLRGQPQPRHPVHRITQQRPASRPTAGCTRHSARTPP